MNSLFEQYTNHVVEIDILYKFGNCTLPQFEKIILHGSTRAIHGQKKQLLRCGLQWELLAFQKPIGTHARKSIAAYSLREKTSMGVLCTLRREKMYDFLTRGVYLYFPRMAGFLPKESSYKDGVWNCVFTDIRSFLEVEYFFQYFENEPGIQCSIFFKKKKGSPVHPVLFLSAYSVPFQ